MQNTVMVARETTELAAEILRGRLEAEGIETFLKGAVVASVIGSGNVYSSSWSNPLGGVEVRVRPEDAAEARVILAEIEARARESRVKQKGPNALQALLGIGFCLAWVPGAYSYHPLLGLGVAAGILTGIIVLARK